MEWLPPSFPHIFTYKLFAQFTPFGIWLEIYFCHLATAPPTIQGTRPQGPSNSLQPHPELLALSERQSHALGCLTPDSLLLRYPVTPLSINTLVDLHFF